jgi:hypothetical protein
LKSGRAAAARSDYQRAINELKAGCKNTATDWFSFDFVSSFAVD